MNAKYSAKQKEIALARPDGVARKATKTYTSVHTRLRRYLRRKARVINGGPAAREESGIYYRMALADVRAWLDRDRDS